MLSISKQLVCQRFIYKIHSGRLRKAKWNLSLSIEDARKNDEVVSLADSQILRWIDDMNGIVDADEQAKEVKREIRAIRKEPTSYQNRSAIRKLYEELDELQFKQDYMYLVIDREKDYRRACSGFRINGVKYVRLLGTNGGVKNSTIVFVSERLAEELKRRIENGRNPDVPLVTAKLESYKSLTCSASLPVSMPHGVIVVDDVNVTFTSDVTYLTDECDGEPIMETRTDEQIEADASDGYGLMLPALAERWSDEMDLGYTACAFNTRMAWEKGMVVTFDFVDFADKVAHDPYVTDAWGKTRDVREAELILTTSMVKLWDSYDSCEHYLSESIKNGYTFGVAKVAPDELENERTLNYQFIQTYDLSDEDIEELTEPTRREFEEILSDDWRKTILFLKGDSLTEKNIGRLEDDFIKAIMIDRRIADDPFVKNTIYQLNRKRINDAKVGVLKVHGNYSIVSGDPYLLCQSVFGLEKTGLLRAGEIYNAYWSKAGAKELACFRAPMSCHENVRAVKPVNRDDAAYWFRYLKTTTVFNGWDTMTMALNGCDYDGDIVMLTDNRILVERMRRLPALMCAQRRAEKRVSTDEDFIQSNIDSFGSDIGQTTNWITSMFDVRSGFDQWTKEYEALTYRIRCGQLYQQNAIDKTKGIVCKPMPAEWHDRHAVNKIEDEETRSFYRRIVADKKPYFMRYIYPALMKQYNTYIKNTDRNALREFQMSVRELAEIPEEERTERQNEFLKYFNYRMPVSVGSCVMNRICRLFESAFDGFSGRASSSSTFDYRFMRSDAEYTQSQFYAIKRLYEDYNRRIQNFAIYADYERVDECEAFNAVRDMNEDFQRECSVVCPDERALCNIVLDLCYRHSGTKRFAWNMCGEQIVRNLYEKNGKIISFPTADPEGDITYCGKRFKIISVSLEDDK